MKFDGVFPSSTLLTATSLTQSLLTFPSSTQHKNAQIAKKFALLYLLCPKQFLHGRIMSRRATTVCKGLNCILYSSL